MNHISVRLPPLPRLFHQCRTLLVVYVDSTSSLNANDMLFLGAAYETQSILHTYEKGSQVRILQKSKIKSTSNGSNLHLCTHTMAPLLRHAIFFIVLFPRSTNTPWYAI